MTGSCWKTPHLLRIVRDFVEGSIRQTQGIVEKCPRKKWSIFSPPPPSETTFASPLRASAQRVRMAEYKSVMCQQQLKRVMLNQKFLFSSAPSLFSIFHFSSLYYASMFVSKMCHSSWPRLIKQEKWGSNNGVSDRFVTRDRRGRWILMTSFQPLGDVVDSDLATAGWPLLQSDLPTDENRDILQTQRFGKKR